MPRRLEHLVARPQKVWHVDTYRLWRTFKDWIRKYSPYSPCGTWAFVPPKWFQHIELCQRNNENKPYFFQACTCWWPHVIRSYMGFRGGDFDPCNRRISGPMWVGCKRCLMMFDVYPTFGQVTYLPWKTNGPSIFYFTHISTNFTPSLFHMFWGETR